MAATLSTAPAREAQPARNAQWPATASLFDRHERMIAEVTAQVDGVLARAEAGVWPQVELRDLVDYLAHNVLMQADDEEVEFFSAKPCAADVGVLNRDHARIRAAVGVLSRVASGEGGQSPMRVAAAVRGVHAQLCRHLRREQELLSRCATASTDG